MDYFYFIFYSGRFVTGHSLVPSDDNGLLLTVTVLVVTLRLPGHRPSALPAGDAAVGLGGEADVVLVGPGEAGRVDHNALAAVPQTQTLGYCNIERSPLRGDSSHSPGDLSNSFLLTLFSGSPKTFCLCLLSLISSVPGKMLGSYVWRSAQLLLLCR